MAEEKAGGTPATRAKNKWNKNNYDSFLLTSIPKGMAEEWKKIAKELGYISKWWCRFKYYFSNCSNEYRQKIKYLYDRIRGDE